MHRVFIIGMLFGLLSVSSHATVVKDLNKDQRNLFLKAELALQTKDRMQYWQLLKKLRDYPLYPYLRSGDLKARLGTAKLQEVQSFLSAYSDSPITSRLRKTWLRSLAKNRQWPLFLKHFKPTTNLALKCLKERALIATNQQYNASTHLKSIWLTGHSLPDECNTLISLWQKNRQITDDLVQQRARLALKTGNTSLARYLTRKLPSANQKKMQVWFQVVSKPALLNSKTVLTHTHASELLMFKFANLAWYQADAAIELLDKIKNSKRFARITGKLKQILAITLARKLHPQAEQWLNAVPANYVTSRVKLWRIRTALHKKKWQQVVDGINGLDTQDRQQDRWRYWQARALSEMGNKQQARAILSDISRNRSYEGFLAADILGQAYAFKHKNLKVDYVFAESLKSDINMQRAHELMKLNRTNLARQEWNRATRHFNKKQLASAAWLAHQWGWRHQVIITLAGIAEWNDLSLRFPLQHLDEINEYTKSTNVDPALALAVIRQESAFAQNAVSRSNARGLMQLLPRTARQVAKQVSVRLTHLSLLNQPGINIKLGVSYLNDIKHKLMQHPVLAIAAYNAGKSRIESWLPNTHTLPTDIWIETIPFKETRNYLRNILAYSAIYEMRLGLPVRKITERMPPIPKPVETIVL